jgi:hypothetical protein
MQNDDWVYYNQVERFLSGDYKLDEYFAPTFYAQGFIAMGFSKLLGIQKLPILTLLFGVSSLFIVFKILNGFMDRSVFDSVLIGLLFFFVPINMYSLWGFMTDTYLLFFFLGAIYFFLVYERMRQTRYFLLTLLFVVLAFFVKQSALILPLSFVVYSLFKKDIESVLFNGLTLISLVTFFFLFFPQTEAMKVKSFGFDHLTEFNYAYGLVYGILIIGAAFFLPLLISRIDIIGTIKDWKKLLLIILVSTLLFFGLNLIYKPSAVKWGEFPYFQNTYERMGFYPRGVHGTKYQFTGNFDLYRYWDLSAKIMLAVFIAYVVIKRELRYDLSLVFVILFMGMSIVLKTYYDRYILTVLPFLLFYVVKDVGFNIFKRLILLAFLAVMIFYSYQFLMDFIKINDYIWNRSEQLVNDENIPERAIHGTNAWKMLYRNPSKDYQYIFSYDSTDVNPELECCYELVEEQKIEYSYNFFIEPKIFLYKKSDGSIIF